MTSFSGVPAAFRTCKTTFQRLSASVHVEPNFLAFQYIRLLLNVLKWLLEWLPKILRALLVFGNNLHRVMLPVLHLQTFLAAQDVLRLKVTQFLFEFKWIRKFNLLKALSALRNISSSWRSRFAIDFLYTFQ